MKKKSTKALTMQLSFIIFYYKEMGEKNPLVFRIFQDTLISCWTSIQFCKLEYSDTCIFFLNTDLHLSSDIMRLHLQHLHRHDVDILYNSINIQCWPQWILEVLSRVQCRNNSAKQQACVISCPLFYLVF